MKIFTTIVVALIVVLITLAALSKSDSTYGQWPVLMLATKRSAGFQAYPPKTILSPPACATFVPSHVPFFTPFGPL